MKMSEHYPNLDQSARFCSRPSSQHNQSLKFGTISNPLHFIGAATILVASIGLTYLLLHFKREVLTRSVSPWIMSFDSRDEGGPLQRAGDKGEDNVVLRPSLDTSESERERKVSESRMRLKIAIAEQIVAKEGEKASILRELAQIDEKLIPLYAERAQLNLNMARLKLTQETQELAPMDETGEVLDDVKRGKNDKSDNDKPPQDSPQG